MSLSRRLAIAFICAFVLHALAVALIPKQSAVDAPREAIIARVTVAHIMRSPTPRPSPSPTPRSVIAQAVIPAGTHARVERIKRVGEKRPTPPKVVYATPDASIPTDGAGAGAQHGSDAGSLSTQNGNGSGTGNAGSGNGDAAPCGAVDFEAIGEAQYDASTGYYQRKIIATVYYADGSSEKIPLNWPWQYKSEADDPFSSDTPYVPFQFPPPDQRASEPPAIQYIIAHTRPNGTTLLNDKCPNIPPPPSPGP
ncbi:MAG TPA: hypothetical protein VF741_03130 [Candidatus Aquilonibacter sp.]